QVENPQINAIELMVAPPEIPPAASAPAPVTLAPAGGRGAAAATPAPAAAAAAAQPAVEDFKPSTKNQPGQQYPMVNSERRARFHVVAPAATSVSVSMGNLRLTKGEDGAWVGTTPPLDEGFHYYHLNVDGGTFNDPGTLNFYG